MGVNRHCILIVVVSILVLLDVSLKVLTGEKHLPSAEVSILVLLDVSLKESEVIEHRGRLCWEFQSLFFWMSV